MALGLVQIKNSSLEKIKVDFTFKALGGFPLTGFLRKEELSQSFETGGAGRARKGVGAGGGQWG